MYVKPVWQMVSEAVSAIDRDVVEVFEITHYIKTKYGDVNTGTIHCQIGCCCVNRQSRVNFSENAKPRIANEKYDFLFYLGKGKVTRYNPSQHGLWEIVAVNGHLQVCRVNSSQGIESVEHLVNSGRMLARRLKSKRLDIPRPSAEEVTKYLIKWNTLENYVAQESALNKLFWHIVPTNSCLDDVLLKVATLNTFYSTNIKSVFTVAKHICSLNIDARLQEGDESLVDEIANVTMPGGKVRNEFSFATKYCSHHHASAYAIYDSYVEKLLCYLRDVDGFSVFHKEELRRFAVLKHVILDFRSFYSLESFTLKEIDQYLWQLGKEMFPKDYSKPNNKQMG